MTHRHPEHRPGIRQFGSTVNVAFLQLDQWSEHQESQEQCQRLGRVATVLECEAARLHAPALALLATRAQLDAFTKVKTSIDKMVAELPRQQQDEIDHRDWCIKEFSENNRSTADAYDKIESPVAKKRRFGQGHRVHDL